MLFTLGTNYDQNESFPTVYNMPMFTSTSYEHITFSFFYTVKFLFSVSLIRSIWILDTPPTPSERGNNTGHKYYSQTWMKSSAFYGNSGFLTWKYITKNTCYSCTSGNHGNQGIHKIFYGRQVPTEFSTLCRNLTDNCCWEKLDKTGIF